MLLNLFNSSKPYVLGLIPLIAFSFWANPIYSGSLPNVEQAMPLYYAVIILLGDFPVIANILAVVLIAIQAIVLNNIIDKHQLLPEKTNIPALLYALLICSCPPLLTLHPILFANLFLMLLIDRLFTTYRKDAILTKVYDAGLLIGIAAMFYLPSIVFLPFYLISLSILRPFNAREWLISFAGFLTPIAFVATNYYWTGELTDVLRSITLTSIDKFTFDLELIIPFLPLIVVISIISLIGIKSYVEGMTNRAVKVSKMYGIFIWFFIFSLLTLILAPSFSAVYFSIAIIALSMYLSNFLVTIKSKKVSEFIFILLLATIIYSHIVTL